MNHEKTSHKQQLVRNALGLGLALITLSACSSSRYVRLAQVEAPPAATPPGGASAQPPGPGEGRIVIQAVAGSASVLDVSDSTSAPRTVCLETPCVLDVQPGHHRYRLLPVHQPTLEGDSSKAKAGTYATPVEADAFVNEGQTRVLTARLGEVDVHRSFPVGRGAAFALVAIGALVTAYGLAAGGSAPNGSPEADTDQGIADFGLGVALIGGSLWLGNATDNVTATERPGAIRWSFP
jgi:hypothetical protein